MSIKMGFLVLAILLVGCSGAKRGAAPVADTPQPGVVGSESENRMEHPGTYLNPQVVTAKEGEPELPAATSVESTQLGGKPFVDGSTIIFQEGIRWESPQNLFLVWNEEALGSRVMDGFFTYRRQTVAGLKFSDEKRNPLSRDGVGRWFVPLKSEMHQSLNEVSSSDEQTFELELHLQNGSIVPISVSMRFLTVPAGVQVTQVPLPELPGDPAEFLSRFNHSQLATEKTKYRNLSTRKVALWLQGSSDQLSFYTGLRESYSVARWDDYAAVPVVADFKRQTPAVLSAEIESAQQVTDVLLNPLHWTKLEIEPLEEVTINWKIVPEANLPICNIPEAKNDSFDINECTTWCGLHHHSPLNAFSVSGMQLRGSISKSVLVTDADIQESDLGFYAAKDESSGSMLQINSGYYRAPDQNLGVDSCVGLVQ